MLRIDCKGNTPNSITAKHFNRVLIKEWDDTLASVLVNVSDGMAIVIYPNNVRYTMRQEQFNKLLVKHTCLCGADLAPTNYKQRQFSLCEKHFAVNSYKNKQGLVSQQWPLVQFSA